MNTIKTLDAVASAAPVPASPPVAPARTPPQAVPAIGDGATSDAIRKHAERRAEAEAAEAERRRKAEKPEPPGHNFDREVGRVGDTFEVFVDLVSSSLKSHRVRIFGPPDNPAPPPLPTTDPASAHAAYAGAVPPPPAVKTDA